MIRSFLSVWLVFCLLQSTCALSIRNSEKSSKSSSLTALEQIQNEKTEKEEAKNTDEVKERNGGKLEEEIDEIGKVMQPHSESAIVEEDPSKVDNILAKEFKKSNSTAAIPTPSESSKLAAVDQSIDGVEGLEAAEDGGEQLRHEGENEELPELGEQREERPAEDSSREEKRPTEDGPKNEIKQLIQGELLSSETPKLLEENVTENATELPTEVAKTTVLIKDVEERHEDPEDNEEQLVTSTTASTNDEVVQQTREIEEDTKESAKKEGINGDIMLEEPIAKYREEQDDNEKRKAEEESGKISWELLQFLFMLAPTDEEEVTWWTVVLEAVKCSLRNCPNNRSYWHHGPMYLPRITRHRRQDSDFDPYTSSNTSVTPKPCPCKNFQTYLEKMQERINSVRKEESPK